MRKLKEWGEVSEGANIGPATLALTINSIWKATFFDIWSELIWPISALSVNVNGQFDERNFVLMSTIARNSVISKLAPYVLVHILASNEMHSETFEPTKRKRRPNYSPAEDRVIVLETYASKAYCTPQKQAELFGVVAEKLNENPISQGTSTGRSIRDRFYRIVKAWRVQNEKLKGISGIDEIVTDVDEALSHIVAAIDDAEETKKAVRDSEIRKKRNLDSADSTIEQSSTTNRSEWKKFETDSKSDRTETTSESDTEPVRKRRKTNRPPQSSEFDRILELMDKLAAKERRQRELDREQ